jgi:OmpA-OmpF porin, OOP family
MKLPTPSGFAILLLAWTAPAQEVQLQAELMNQVGTDTSRKGDLVSARVVSPQALQGDILEGKVSDAKSGGKVGGKSALKLSFDTLRHGGEAIPLSAEVRSLTNSKGVMNADEEGRVVRSSNGNLGKLAAATGAGALVGGLIGGGKGAAIGAGAGAVGSLVLIEVVADGPNVRLDPGSRVTLSARSRSGPALDSLTPNAASSASATPASRTVPQSVAQPAPPAPATVVANRPAAAPTATQPAAQSGAPGSAQPNLTAVKSDFIAGEKAIFFDDFTDMAGDEPPPHWKVRGGTAELRTGAGIRQLTLSNNNMVLTPNLTGLPKNFTMEADLKFENVGSSEAIWSFYKKDGYRTLSVAVMMQNHENSCSIEVHTGDPRESSERIGEVRTAIDWRPPMQQALWVQDGRVRLYINGTRYVDVNQIKLEDIGYVQFEDRLDDTANCAVGLRRVRFAEGAPDFGKTILSSGRYVTHGILFDTDSDRIKPESGPVIKSIARAFETNPNLKMLIEGHTDSTGDAAHNLDLSKRRAEAVKSVLVAQFSVEAGRLTTAGLGATKPMDTNDTPTGRAQNRRVELVKQ